MSALSMSPAEREQFLADVRIGVLGIARDGKAPILTPVWYRFVDGVVEIATAASTQKVGLLRSNPEATLCVQKETNPPAYVTVEGTVTIEDLPAGVVETIAARYIGPEAATQFAEVSEDDTLLRFHIHKWRAADFGKVTG